MLKQILGRSVPIALILAALLVGACYSWIYRSYYSEGFYDLLSYLDIARGVTRNQWSLLLNSYWSSLYPLILGLVFKLHQPSPEWEMPLIRLINFVIYAGSLSAFALLIRECISSRGTRSQEGEWFMPDWGVWGMGIALFLTLTTSKIGLLWFPKPDLLACGLFFLGCTFLIRANNPHATWTAFIGTGVTFGLLFLAKSAFLPVSVVVLAACAGVAAMKRETPRALRAFQWTISLVILLLISAAFIVPLSLKHGQFTWNSSGKLNYAWAVNKVPKYFPPQVEPWASQLVHPMTTLIALPETFLLDALPEGTDPLWADPSYWYEGLKITIAPKQFLANWLNNLVVYLRIFSHHIWSFGFILLLLAASIVERPRRLAGTLQHWSPLLLAILGLTLYSLVVIEIRYIAPMLIALPVICAASTAFRSKSLARNIALLCVAFALFGLSVCWINAREPWVGENNTVELANAMIANGIRNGDRVAFYGWGGQDFFALQLAGARVVARSRAETPSTAWLQLLSTDPAARDDFLELCAKHGIRAVFLSMPKDFKGAPGWQLVEGKGLLLVNPK